MDESDSNTVNIIHSKNVKNENIRNVTDEKLLKDNSVIKSTDLEEENRMLKEARLCKICMDIEVGVVFLPCGHLAACTFCAPNLKDCPLCRAAIKATVRTFLS